MISSRTFLTVSRISSRGCLTSVAEALRSAVSSATLRVNAAASDARSIAFLNRLVAISSIVRVILRMLVTALRRCTSSRVFAMFFLENQRFAGENLSHQFKQILACVGVDQGCQPNFQDPGSLCDHHNKVFRAHGLPRQLARPCPPTSM